MRPARAQPRRRTPAEWWVDAWRLLGLKSYAAPNCSTSNEARRWFRVGVHFGRAVARRRDSRAS